LTIKCGQNSGKEFNKNYEKGNIIVGMGKTVDYEECREEE
jgi:hypothetical protein